MSALNRFRRAAYRSARLAGDARAVQTGRIGQRVGNRIIGRAVRRAMRKVWL